MGRHNGLEFASVLQETWAWPWWFVLQTAWQNSRRKKVTPIDERKEVMDCLKNLTIEHRHGHTFYGDSRPVLCCGEKRVAIISVNGYPNGDQNKANKIAEAIIKACHAHYNND
jgi:hypothetical protein